MTQKPLLELQGITKHYGGVCALDGADFSCAAGEIHAVLGENGAGKSTLIKIIAGVVQPDAGRILLDGKELRLDSPNAARDRGIVCVFQELSLVPDLSVCDNIFLSRPPMKYGLIDARAQQERAAELLFLLGCADIHPMDRVRDLPLSRRQVVELAKALGARPRLLILDEATSALSSEDVERLYRLLFGLRDQGVAALFISHRMHEVKTLADTCSVFRSGRRVDTFVSGTRSDAEVVQLMIGRDVAKAYPPKTGPAPDAPPAVTVKSLSWDSDLRDISLEIRQGEIVGLGGLDGQGQRELLLALFGVLRGVHGGVEVFGQQVAGLAPHICKQSGLGIALIPEDRKTEGLVLPMSIRENASLAHLEALGRYGLLSGVAEKTVVAQMVDKLRIKLGSVEDPVQTLSGGNQQKVVIAKWLMTQPRVLLLNDPTRGIDVATKQEIYVLLRQLAAQGVAILLYSTDYEELIGLADRVLIMYEGRIARTLAGDEITEQEIVASSLNVSLVSPEPEAIA
ncbi:sugar ABC transporter ATP-binding protein [Polaromonas sp. A23]|uniref:sugar ABC transporter ATP-binding protein n=1 Tax=Polaromonas sp. A23 TaxID=1944133 RepID=UPI0009865E46|nr:sugar ABC transporter ATP-binding protein [Polaromonas sp. A23]OOG44006.1 sugar ABC transporter ATP-binding protein [Polaromonas sp. A23]